MRIFELDTELWLPRPRAEVFPFFADAANLERITPPWLHFEITSKTPVEMRPGAKIDYRLRVHGVPVRWKSEITAWEPPYLFVDEQRRGPYRLWHHTHTFEEKDGGTLCRDRVRYAVPFGRLANWLMVRRDVEQIFAFRAEALKRIFAPDALDESAPPPPAKPESSPEQPRLRLIAGGR